MSDCRSLSHDFAAWGWLKLAETSSLAVLDSDYFLFGSVLLCLPRCLCRFMLVERQSVCVLASTVDDWLLRRVGGFALYSLDRGYCNSLKMVVDRNM